MRVVQSEKTPVFANGPTFVSDECSQRHLVQVYAMDGYFVTTTYISNTEENTSPESLQLRGTIALLPRSAMNKLTEIELCNFPSYDHLEPCTGPQPVTVRGWHPE